MYVLKELIAFYEYGTLTAAAEQLNVSQPALSRSMKKLEDDLEADLFDRSRNRITLNETGRIAAELARKVIEEEEAFERKVKEHNRLNRVFTFGSIAPMPISKLTGLLSEYLDGMTVESVLYDSEKELYRDLSKDRLKLIVTHSKPKDTAKYCYEKLFEEHLYAVLPDTHRLAGRESISLREHDGENILIYNRLGFWYENTRRLIPKAEFLEQSEQSALKKLVEITPLASFATDMTMNESGAPLSKKAIPIADREVNVTFYCVVLRRNLKELSDLLAGIRSHIAADSGYDSHGSHS